jgi:hypothetical protein
MIKNYISILLVPAIAVIILLFFPLDPENPKVTYTFCIALLMATWWITEIVPLAVTSLLPVALFPLYWGNGFKRRFGSLLQRCDFSVYGWISCCAGHATMAASPENRPAYP